MSCCLGWQAQLLPGEGVELRTSIQGHPGFQDRVHQSLDQMVTANAVPKTSKGECVMLESCGKCGIQSQLGEKALPFVCSTYPRMMQRVGPRVELSAKTSCPEVARLLLLSSGATDRVSHDESLLPRTRVHFSMDDPNASPWSKHLDALRNLAMEMLTLPYPTGHNLFFLTEVAQRLNHVLNENTKEDPGMKIQQAIEPLLNKKNLEATSAHLNELNWNAKDALPFLINLLTIRAVGAGAGSEDPMRTLYGQVCAFSGLNPLDIEGSAEQLWTLHVKRSAQLNAQCGEALETYSKRFAMHYWFHELFPRHSDLKTYMIRLLLLNGVHRVLLVNHPDIASCLDRSEPVPKKVLEKTAVRVLAKSTRGFEHHKMLNAVLSALNTSTSWPLVQKLCFI
jgi:lysine-N-methylase